jgi:ParB family chromosome partitioning protein
MDNKRGLKELLSENLSEEIKDYEKIEEIDLSLIFPNENQPRKVFDHDKLEELKESIMQYGVFQPIIVRKYMNKYIIVSGERRYRASLMAGKRSIPAVVRNYNEEKVSEIALLENIQREDLNILEEANAYKILIEKFNLTHDELAKKVSKSRSHITNILGILKLPEVVKDDILNNKISMGHARSLSKLKNQEEIINLSEKIKNEKLSVRNVESIIKNGRNDGKDNKLLEIEEKYNVKVKFEKNKLIIKGNIGSMYNVIKRLSE